ncbi:MAG: transcriptional regulator [Candidatus Eremiobacteraeota bacterium]|nr:transcriptional regulator [Candidatus Eremiobacteraeota bacterium]
MSDRAPYAFDALERVFHERGRLAICSALVTETGMSFRQLQDACDLTDGNLNRHLHALAEMGVVAVTRKTGSGRPQTTVRITPKGRERFLAYIDALESIVRSVQDAASAAPVKVRGSRLATQ